MRNTKTTAVRRGVVYTPNKVAIAVCKQVLNEVTAIDSVLEPSVGDGVFLKSLINLGVASETITAIDISKVATKKIVKNFADTHAISDDFISFYLANSEKKFDVVIGNPPYVRRHNFTKQQYKSISALSERTEYPLSELKNAWAAFVLAGCKLINESGRLAFIIPYEFLTVSYGKFLQSWILNNVGQIEIFVPEAKAFPDIDQDAILLTISPMIASEAKLLIHKVESLSDLSKIHTTSTTIVDHEISAIERKRFLLGDEAAALLTNLAKKLRPISEYCSSATGTVTAANDFFILSDEDILKHHLQKWSQPILKKASYLSDSIYFTKQDFDNLSKQEPCYLVNFGESSMDELGQDAEKYIKYGEREGFNKRYKCRHRSPWYKVPSTPKADAYFFKRSHLTPRMAINTANVEVTDTAYRLTMEPSIKVPAFCFSFYNSLTLLFAEIFGRFYGGGVLELTPKEFRALPLCYVEPEENEFLEFQKAIEFHLSESQEVFTFGDKWLQERMQLSSEQIKLIQSSLINVRKHRIRHGSKGHTSHLNAIA